MNKTLLLAAMVTALSAGGVGAAGPAANKATARPVPKALPVFDFLGQTTETATTMTKIGSSPCVTNASIRACEAKFGEGPKIGEASLVYFAMRYHNEKLYMVDAMTVGGYFSEMARAFTAKYGRPDKVETRKWQNRMGNTFDNNVLTWAFKGGTLELRSMGDKSDESVFQFISVANAPPVAAPVINF